MSTNRICGHLRILTGLKSGGGTGIDVPGQKLCDAIDRVVGNARQHLAQVGLRIESIELRRSD